MRCFLFPLQPIDFFDCIINNEPDKLPEDKYSKDFSNFIDACLEKNQHFRPKPVQLIVNI